MTLSFKIPKDENKAGQDNCKGKGTVGKCQGLQEGFAKDLAAAIDKLKNDKEISITVGYSGFVSRVTADDWAKNGNPPFRNRIKHFGWGIAAEVETVSTGLQTDTGAPFGAKQDDINTILGLYGLAWDKATASNKNTNVVYIRPGKIEEADVETLEVSGEPASNGDVAASEGAAAETAGTASVSSIAYYFANQFQSVAADVQSQILKGDRALANDVPLFNYVSDAVKSSMRTFASGPNGEFFAWYPDFWGMYGDAEGGSQDPYLVLEDVELKDLTITQSDQSFYTHCYCPGKTVAGKTAGLDLTQGVVSIESPIDATAASAQQSSEGTSEVSDEVSAILKRIIHMEPEDEWKYTPKELYRRYGARPHKTTTNAIENEGEGAGTGSVADYENDPTYILPFLRALYDFMEQWSRQYRVNLTLTFMPELFPGARIKIRSLDLTVYVESVNHTMSYTGGFSTTATCSCPVGTLFSGMVNPDFTGSSMVDGDSKDFGK